MGRLIKGEGRVVPAAELSARQTAAELVARAKLEADAIRAQAERAGYQAGLAAGLEAGAAQAAELVVAARVHAESVRARARDGAVALARRMAEKIVRRTVTLDGAAMAEIVSQAVEASRAADGAVVVRVHPDDLAAVEESRPRWAERLSARAALRVLADPAVGRAGCVVDTPVGRLDARLTVHLDAFTRAVADRR
jgi:flagellar biosynthesis/type III secretory pathway protein FliH